MTLTARDRKLVAILLVAAAAACYWFLILGPKREDAQQAAQQLSEQEERRDAALATLAQLESARTTFAADYASIVRLGKAIPSDVDVPSLMVQLEEAADQAGIEFDSITVGERTAVVAAPQAPGGSPPPADSQPAAAPGGDSAQTAPGQAAETAGETADAASADASPPATGSAASASTATEPSPTGSESASAQPPVSGAPALEGVPLDFSFEGDFFDLADLFHELKRFVHVRGDRVDVDGRLLTIDGLSLTPSEKGSELTAAISATAYLAPAGEGSTAGATPAGPAGSVQPATADAPAPTPDGAPPSATGTAPTAGVTP